MTTTDADVRAAHVALYGRMLAAQNARDLAGWLATLSEDVVFEAPYYRAGGPIAAGTAGMTRMFGSLLERFVTIRYEIAQIIPALDPGLVIAQVRGDNEVRGTGARYRNDYLFLVTCVDGRISRIFEYSDPTVYARSVGTPATS